MRNSTVKIKSEGNFEDIHRQGAIEFGAAWLAANMAVTEYAQSRVNISDPAAKELLSLVTLRILKRLKATGYLKELK